MEPPPERLDLKGDALVQDIFRVHLYKLVAVLVGDRHPCSARDELDIRSPWASPRSDKVQAQVALYISVVFQHLKGNRVAKSGSAAALEARHKEGLFGSERKGGRLLRTLAKEPCRSGSNRARSWKPTGRRSRCLYTIGGKWTSHWIPL